MNKLPPSSDPPLGPPARGSAASSFEALSARLARLSDRELLEQVGRMAGEERGATARLIASLAEMDRRQLYRDAGCSSLFTFCTDVLKLSESEAYLRIEAARAARKFPLVLERLADGTLTLTAVSKLAKHLTEQNHRALLDSVRQKSKREIEELLARLHPRPDAREMVRRLPEGRAGATSAALAEQPRTRADDPVAFPAGGIDRPVRSGETSGRLDEAAPPGASLLEQAETSGLRTAAQASGLGTAQQAASTSRAESPALAQSAVRPLPARAAAAAARPRDSIMPLAPQRYRVQLTIGAETNEKLRRVRDLLRHDIPDGDLAQVFDRALTRLLAELEKTRFAATARPKAPRRPSAPLHSSPKCATPEPDDCLVDGPLKMNPPQRLRVMPPGSTDGRPLGERGARCSDSEAVLEELEAVTATPVEGALRLPPTGRKKTRRREDFEADSEQAASGKAGSGRAVPGPVVAAAAVTGPAVSGSLAPGSSASGPARQMAAAARRRSRHIPAAVKREVWRRDEGRCAFVGPHGRCRERGMLEYHHREPFAAGGKATASNVTLLCRAHNSLEADRYFGPPMSDVDRYGTRVPPAPQGAHRAAGDVAAAPGSLNPGHPGAGWR